jgi:hypothetical protein
MDEGMNDEQAAQLLLNFARRNGIMVQPDGDPPAQILDHAPAHGEAVIDGQDEDHRRRGLLLSSLGPIAAMMGAGFIFIQQLFEEQGYDMNTLFRRPTMGEYLVDLTAQEKQVFCANTAYYIDAMRHNKQLEVITVDGVQKLKPLSQSVSTDVATMTPSSTMRLNGNEVIENVGGNIVYKQGDTSIVIPEDPIEISAFCMAHFFNTENVQILMNWGEDFKLVSEADLLRLLGEMSQGDDWKQRIIGNIFNSVYSVYNQTGPYLDFITTKGASISNAIKSAPANMRVEWEVATEVTLPRYREQLLNNLARNHPQAWAAANTVMDYPIPSTILALIVLYYLRKPIRVAATIVNETVRLPFRILSWFTGQNPDRAAANEHLAIANAAPPGRVRRGGGNQQPLSVIVINNPLPPVYIAELEKIFDKDGSIESFVTHINMNTVPLPKTKLQKLKKLARKATKSFKKSLIKGFKNGFKRFTGKKGTNDPTSVTAMEVQGGKKSKRRKQQNKRKTHKR